MLPRCAALFPTDVAAIADRIREDRPAAAGYAPQRTAIFADGADLAGIIELSRHPLISGFTTNPTLMRTAGVTEYEVFARNVLTAVPDMPVSFEVFADDFD